LEFVVLDNNIKKVQSVKELGALIRQRRKAMGLTQVELSGFCGCSAKFLTDLEGGKPTVRLDKVLPVVMMLGCDLYVRGRAGAEL
jgi:y4mF family transcriptional regulator